MPVPLPRERIAYAVHWKTEYDKPDGLIREHGLEIIGAEDFRLTFAALATFRGSAEGSGRMPHRPDPSLCKAQIPLLRIAAACAGKPSYSANRCVTRLISG